MAVSMRSVKPRLRKVEGNVEVEKLHCKQFNQERESQSCEIGHCNARIPYTRLAHDRNKVCVVLLSIVS
jgi:hypothetical protein